MCTAARQNQQYGQCAQRRRRSVWASAQSDQSSLCAQWVANDPILLHATAKTLIRLGHYATISFCSREFCRRTESTLFTEILCHKTRALHTPFYLRFSIRKFSHPNISHRIFNQTSQRMTNKQNDMCAK